jgi:hypothetical protein
MELWSNDVLTEFTIKFNSVIAVTTSNNPDTIVKMIDECPYKPGYEFDWHYSFSVGCLLFWQTNLLLYWTPKPLYKKSSIFETMKIMKLALVYTILSVVPSK